MIPSDALRGINRGINLAQASDDFALGWPVCARFFVPADLQPMVGARYVFSTKAGILEPSQVSGLIFYRAGLADYRVGREVDRALRDMKDVSPWCVLTTFGNRLSPARQERTSFCKFQARI